VSNSKPPPARCSETEAICMDTDTATQSPDPTSRETGGPYAPAEAEQGPPSLSKASRRTETRGPFIDCGTRLGGASR
jgi:hypothetical protein